MGKQLPPANHICLHCGSEYTAEIGHSCSISRKVIPSIIKSTVESDPVNHPSHYTSSPASCPSCGDRIECIDITRHQNFNLGNAMKYIWRTDMKNGIEDLEKAKWYISDEIMRRTRLSEKDVT